MAQDCIPCVTTAPSYVDFCSIVGLNPGGYAGFAFIKCGQIFTDVTDAAEWGTKLAAGNISSTLFEHIKGSRPISTVSTKDVSSCCPVTAVNYAHSFEFMDEHATDPTVGALQIPFYNYFKKHYRKYQFAAISCDERVEIVNACYSFTAVQTVEADFKTNGTRFWTIKVEWIAYDDVVPVLVPGIKQAILDNM